MWETIFSGATALGTLGAVAVALWLGLRQGKSDREALHNSRRPIISPAKETFTKVYKPQFASQGATSADDVEKIESVELEFGMQLPSFTLSLRNVGPGVALNVDGVLIEPKPAIPSPIKAQSYRLNLGVPIASGDLMEVRVSEGGTMLDGTQQIVPGYELYAPQKPSERDRYRGVGGVKARLTLTCSDTFGTVHAFVYDYTDNHKWVFRASAVVEKSIDDLNREVASNAIPGPSNIPTALQGYATNTEQ